MSRTSQIEMWIPGTVLVRCPTEPKWNVDLVELLRREPAGDVRAGGVEGDVAEVEQARVADDDVQAEAIIVKTIMTTIESVRRDEVADQRAGRGATRRYCG